MAMQPISAMKAGRPAANTAAMGPLKKASMLAGLAALIGAGSARNVFAASMLMVAAPLTATGFVYEVEALRKAQLAHEAADRVQYASFLSERTNMATDRDLVTSSISKTTSDGAFTAKVDDMIKSRSVLLDTFGDDASTVAPVYATIIKRMLKDDEVAFDTFAAKRRNAAPSEAAKLADQETLLREVHVKLAHLAKG
jgi:hypothetical protein